MTAWLVAGAVAWPLLLAIALAGRRSRATATALSASAAAPMLAVSLAGPDHLSVPWLALDARLGLDAVAAPLLPATAALWLAAGLVARRYLPAAEQARFYAWFGASMAGNFALLAAGDVVTFYYGFALMSFAAYGLVVHRGDARARHAARYYLAMVVIGEVLVITALMILAQTSGIDFAAIRAGWSALDPATTRVVVVLLLAGFGIKAGVAGFHYWLPLAHPVAPAPASAVLSGAMIKAGLVAWLRLLPIGQTAMPRWGTVVAALGIFTAFYGVAAGLAQREAKTVLAYSSISQMGLMVFGLGLALALPAHQPLLLAAVLLFAVHHGLTKGALFLGAGLTQHGLSPREGRVVWIGLLIGSLALAGAPLTGGVLAKLSLKHGAELTPAPWDGWLALVLTISSGATALLLARFLFLARPRPGSHGGAALLWPWVALLFVGVAVAPWWLADEALQAEALGAGAAVSSLLPLAVAAGIAGWTWRRARQGRPLATPPIPAGDLGMPIERLVRSVRLRLEGYARGALPALDRRLRQWPAATFERVPTWRSRLGRAEAGLSHWTATALLLIAVAVGMVWFLA